MDNQITDAANEILLKRLDGKHPGPDDPFYTNGIELYLKYDSIQIRNTGTANVQAGYYWKGVKMAIFPIPDVQLNFNNAPSAAKHLELNGIEGAMRLVLL